MTDQLDIMDEIEARARSSDPDTSHTAAAGVNAGNLSETCERVYGLLDYFGPCTDVALQSLYDRSASAHGWPMHRCVRKRRKDLVDAGRAEWNGQYVTDEAGIRFRVWRAK